MIDGVHSDGHRLQQLRKLTEVSRALTYAASLEEVFRLTVDRAASLVAGEKALLLTTNDDGVLVVRASQGVDQVLAQRLAERFREPLNEALAPRLAGLLDTPPDSFLGVPLVVGGGIKGILVVIRAKRSSDPEHDEWLLSALADQAAVALETTRLNEVGEFREQLIGIVGHDLRNPLSTIQMGGQLLLQSEGLGKRETDLARRIASSAALAGRLIDQLLDLTRSRLGGGIPIEPRRVDLSDVCRQVIGEIQMSHLDRQLSTDLQGDVTGVWDRDRIYQLLSNLVGNAVHHGDPHFPIELRVDGSGSDLVIAVSNRGAAISPALLPFIFDAFRKSRTDHPSQATGLGLGLFIAQQIARAHGGAISVTSTESDGTTFAVRLPRETPPGRPQG